MESRRAYQGTTGPTESSERPPEKTARASWRGQVLSRIERLSVELALAPEPVDAPATDAAREIQRLLDDARRSATRGGLGRSLVNTVTGTDIERAWRALHQARELLFLVESDATIKAKVPGLEAAVNSRFDRDDPRSVEYRAVLQAIKDGGKVPDGSVAPAPKLLEESFRQSLREIQAMLHRISDDAHGRVRNFRNVVLTAIVILSVGLVIIAFDPPDEPWLPVCVLGDAGGSCPTVWQIELVGALGGLLAGVTALRALQGFAGPYGLPVTMALLKVPTGALTGLLGALWMQNEVLPGITPQEGTTLFAYVALFGFAQQALTTFADKQAGNLLSTAQNP